MHDPSVPLAIVATLPADLRQALARRYACVSHHAHLRLPGVRMAVTTSMAGADAALLDSLPDLGLLACQGAGLDRIDLDAARARGIRVAHTPDVFTEDVAEFAVALMLAVVRRVGQADAFVRAGRWSAARMTSSVRLAGKRLGVVGLGRIGAAIARRGEALGMVVGWYGPHSKPDTAWPRHPSTLALAGWSDILVMATPGGCDTAALVDDRVLAALGSTGWLVNVARGTVVDEGALLTALETGAIAGAGLDVFADEPVPDPRFAALTNVVLAPHYASNTVEARADVIATILRHLDDWVPAKR